MKITGRELIAFMDTGWPQPEDDWYWDHEEFEYPEPDVVYDTEAIGPVQYQGHGEDPTNGDGYDLARMIRKWRKCRDFDVLQITVQKGKTDAVRAILAAMEGVKIIM